MDSGRPDVTPIDLTHLVEDGMQTYPGDPAVSVSPHATHERDGYAVSAVELGTHAGTHVDAPAHTEPDGDRLGAYDLTDLRFDARRVDLALDDREAIAVADLDAVTGTAVDDVDCLVLDTGWADHWGTDRYLDHPYLAPDAAAWCAERGLAVASDTLSPDPTPSPNAGPTEPSGVPAHHELLGVDLPVVENLTGLDALPSRFTLELYPLALDADGAPVRAVAWVDE